MRARVRPCLQYQIKRCPAPCVRDVDRAEYGEQVRLVGLFLDGRHDELVRDLDRRMKGAAKELDYERAAIYRDQLRAIERVREEQRVTVVKDVDQDVVGLFRQADQAEVAVLMIRGGKLVGVRTYALKSTSLPDDEIVASFVAEYYGEGAFVPEEVVLPMEIEAMSGLEAVLADRREGRVHVVVPQRGAKKKLLEMAEENAAHAFREKAREREDVEERLGQVQRRLRLSTLPRRIECIDVSHIGGEDTVAVIVALENGAPDRKRYRSFVVRKAKAGDDYGAMMEVLSRRFERAKSGDAKWDLPDLLVVDGGKGQLNVALGALRDLGIEGLEVAALAKEKENLAGDKLVDRVYRPGAKNAVSLRESSPALRMLALARDEAHRASNALREKRGTKRRFASALDEVRSIGPKTRQKLLGALGSLDAIKRATVEELVRAGATEKQAAAIARAFGDGATAAGATPAEAALPPMNGTPVDAQSTEEAELTAVDNAFAE
jgi:excinuclease ABC subunit C